MSKKTTACPKWQLFMSLFSDVQGGLESGPEQIVISLVNVIKSEDDQTADLLTFTEEILNGKLQFSCSVR